MKSFVFLLVLQMILNPRGLVPLEFLSRKSSLVLNIISVGGWEVSQPYASYILGSLGVSQFSSVSLNMETASELESFNKFEALFHQDQELEV